MVGGEHQKIRLGEAVQYDHFAVIVQVIQWGTQWTLVGIDLAVCTQKLMLGIRRIHLSLCFKIIKTHQFLPLWEFASHSQLFLLINKSKSKFGFLSACQKRTSLIGSFSCFTKVL